MIESKAVAFAINKSDVQCSVFNKFTVFIIWYFFSGLAFHTKWIKFYWKSIIERERNSNFRCIWYHLYIHIYIYIDVYRCIYCCFFEELCETLKYISLKAKWDVVKVKMGHIWKDICLWVLMAAQSVRKYI